MLLGQKTQRLSDQMVSTRSNTEIAIPPKRVQSPPKLPNLAAAAILNLYPVKKQLCTPEF